MHQSQHEFCPLEVNLNKILIDVMFVNPDGQPALAPSGLIQAGFLGKSCDVYHMTNRYHESAVSNGFIHAQHNTTHALSHQLSPASRYLRPSSYLRHALLLGFSSSPSYIYTHSVVFDMYIFFYLPFCSCKLVLQTSCPPFLLIFVTCCFFVSISVLICLDRQQGSSLLIVTIFHGVPLPLHTALNFCSFAASHTLRLSLWAVQLIQNVYKKTQSAHSELQKAAIFFFPLHREMLQRASPTALQRNINQ